MNSARDEILARIDASLGRGDLPPGPPEHAYRRHGELGAFARVALFCDRAASYRATVLRSSELEAASAIEKACSQRSVARVVVPADSPWPWPPAGVELVPDRDLSHADLDRAEGVLTECAVAIAETGTIALDGGSRQGRRALTLVPDFHLCVVRTSRIVELVPEGVAALAPSARAGRPISLVSGPSATADIEFDRVEGVHGPRDLVVLVVDDQS